MKRRRQAGAGQRRGGLLDGHGDRRVDRAVHVCDACDVGDLTTRRFLSRNRANAIDYKNASIDLNRDGRRAIVCLASRMGMIDRCRASAAAAGLCVFDRDAGRRARGARAGRTDGGAPAPAAGAPSVNASPDGGAPPAEAAPADIGRRAVRAEPGRHRRERGSRARPDRAPRRRSR